MWAIIGSLLITTPKEITPEWETEVFGVHHRVMDVADSVEEMTASISEEYFGKDLLRKLKGLSTGEYIEHWESGQIKVRLPYKNGNPHGHLHGWYPDGKDAFKGYFYEGIKQGVHISFYPPGRSKRIGRARTLTYNEKGQLEGDQLTSHSTGDLHVAMEYVKGMAEGPLECWDEDGKQTLSVDYKKGKLQKNPPPPPPQRGRPPVRKDNKYVDEVIAQCAKQVEQEFGFRVYGTGASMPWDVEGISIDFAANRTATVKEARKLLLQVVDRLVTVTNAHVKLRPYLREYPFTAKRADVSISFKEGEVAHVFMGQKNIIFYKGKTEFQETYEEALKRCD